MLIELMKVGNMDLARRWLATLMLVPAEERESVVEAVEGRIVEVYDRADGRGAPGDREIVVRYPAVQREGYVEEVVKTYEVRKGSDAAAPHEEKKSPRAAGGEGA